MENHSTIYTRCVSIYKNKLIKMGKEKMRKRHTLKKELTVFMSLASVVTLMLVVLAVCYVFFSFFFENTQEDIEYVPIIQHSSTSHICNL